MFKESRGSMIKSIDSIVIRFICCLKIIIESRVVKSKGSGGEVG